MVVNQHAIIILQRRRDGFAAVGDRRPIEVYAGSTQLKRQIIGKAALAPYDLRSLQAVVHHGKRIDLPVGGQLASQALSEHGSRLRIGL